LVINLPNKNTKHIKENYLIRRAAVDYGIGCISNLEVYEILQKILLI
jgi:carbamoyl-phosphate synthase (ammonia)